MGERKDRPPRIAGNWEKQLKTCQHVFKWFFNGFQWFFVGFSLVFLWFFLGFSLVFPWFFLGFSLVCSVFMFKLNDMGPPKELPFKRFKIYGLGRSGAGQIYDRLTFQGLKMTEYV